MNPKRYAFLLSAAAFLHGAGAHAQMLASPRPSATHKIVSQDFLYCKVGPGLDWETHIMLRPVAVKTTSGETANVLTLELDYTITFKRGTQAARSNGSGLGAGECAWPDRPLSASEPAAFRGALAGTSLGLRIRNGQVGSALHPFGTPPSSGSVFKAPMHRNGPELVVNQGASMSPVGQ